ncbi:MAG: ATP synthase F1 subunit gamma [Bacteroidota bacterium]
MPNIKEVVDRIGSVTSTQQITKAMKMVAAAKLNKVQQQVQTMRPYATKLATILENVTASTEQSFAQQYLTERPVNHLLVVVISADRGLCGSSNTNVLNRALKYIQETTHTLPQAQVTVLPIGKKAHSFFAKRGFQLRTDYVALSGQLRFAEAGQAAAALTQAFLQGTYDKILLVYNEFQSAATQAPVVSQLLPIAHQTAEENAVPTGNVREYIHEPSKEALVETLVPQSLQIQFYKALLEANASEHGARMTTMSKATDNADELLQSLRLTYNRNRQAAITREISEIVAGSEALS